MIDGSDVLSVIGDSDVLSVIGGSDVLSLIDSSDVLSVIDSSDVLSVDRQKIDTYCSNTRHQQCQCLGLGENILF